jgi:hypothetical protein
MRRSSRPDADTQRFPAKWPSGSPQKTRQRNVAFSGEACPRV